MMIKKGTLPEVTYLFFKPVSIDSNLRTTTVREDNVHDLESPSTQLPNQPPANIIPTNIEEENMSSESPQAELLRWHYHLGHSSFTRLWILAFLGILPRNLLKVKLTKCAGCLYFTMTKRPWRTKSANT